VVTPETVVETYTYPLLHDEHPPFALQVLHPVAQASQVFPVVALITKPILQLPALHVALVAHAEQLGSH